MSQMGRYIHLVFVGLSCVITALFVLLWAVSDTSASNLETSVTAPIPQKTDNCLQPETCFAEALERHKQGKREEAQEMFRVLREKFQEPLWNARAAFVLGTLALEVQSDDAYDLFQQAMNLKAVRDYNLFYQAEAYRQKDLWPQAVELYDQLIADYPDSVLRSTVFYKRATALMASGDCTRARKGFEEYTSRYPNHDEVPEAFLQLADCLLKLDEPVQSVKTLRRIWTRYPVDPAEQEAQQIVFRLMSRGITIPEPLDEERYHRAQILFKTAQYKKALPEFLTLSNNAKNKYHDEATVMLAMTQLRLKRYKEARLILEKFIREFPQSEWLRKALHNLALTAFRLQDKKLLLGVEKRLADQFPQSHQRAHALIMMGRFYEDQEQPEQALQTYRQILSEFKQDHLVYDALWNIGWMAYKTGRYESAIETFASYAEHADFQRQGKEPGRFMYWTGRSAENLDQLSKAASAYKKVCGTSPRTYYCQMAKERLVRLKPLLQETGQFIKPSPLPQRMKLEMDLSENESSHALLENPHYQTAKELMVMGFNKEAADEFDLLAGRHVNDRGTLLLLSNRLFQVGDYYRSLRILRMYFSDILQNGSGTVPSSFWEQAFPLEMVQWIRDQVLPGSADPYVVAAIMREESALNPKAISNAGAIGLMQIMPYTGEWVARQVGYEPFEPADLMNPDLNIRFGSWYLGHLAQQFNGNLILTIASYNAGPEAVMQWTKNGLSPTDAHDEFVESIPFSETRSFTKRVLRSYTEYLGLAGFDPAHRFTRSILSP